MNTACVEAPAKSWVEHAREYADRFGWACIPVRGKTATGRYQRFLSAPQSRQQMYGMFGVKGATGLAVITGSVSDGLRVRDYDQADAYARWAAAHPGMAAALPTARTARGYHVYFRSADLPDTPTAYADGELRAGRCYVVAPPSEHPDGGRYEWVFPPGETIPVVPDPAHAGLVGPAPAAPPAPTPVPPGVAGAIEKTLPTGPGQRNDRVFRFARRLKAVPGLDTTYAALASYIREWHRRALPVIHTKAFHETEKTFFDAWKSATSPLSDDQFGQLVCRALAAPDPDWYVHLLHTDGARKLLKVCMALHADRGGGPFFLAARKAGEVINVDPTHACRLLNGL
ncbi:MAG TPA: bifunctional DNA primase/polymerase, partial [Urbifossiella sp.]|nr:bifunctional DNA primase/polymerase [Urbifossiella sp.]